MPLLSQFQTFIGSFFLGSFFLFTWTLFNRIFYSQKLFFIRIPFEILLFLLFSKTYYVFLCEYGYGLFNIFYILSLLLGMYFYYRFYAYSFELFFEKVAISLKRIIIIPFELKIKIFRDKFKNRRKQRKHDKKIIKKHKQIN